MKESFNIFWRIEDDKDSDVKIHPDDLLGEICLSSHGEFIQEKDTYLDDWFNALIHGYEFVVKGESGRCDLVCESSPLHFEMGANNFRITYKQSSIIVSSVHEFQRQLVWSAQKLARRVDRSSKSFEPFQKIDVFISTLLNS